MRFYGRENEIAALHKQLDLLLAGAPSRIVAVEGRRRIGKTALLLKAFEKAPVPVFYCLANRTAIKKDLGTSWASEFARGFGEAFAPAADTPARALEYALTLSEKRPCVILIDDCQALATASPGFWPKTRTLWARKKNASRALLVFSSVQVTAIESLFETPESTPSLEPAKRISLASFPPSLLRTLFREEAPSGTALDLLLLFALTDGIPQRLATLVDTGAAGVESALDFFYSEAGAWFRNELGASLTKDDRVEAPANAQILRAIARGASRWREIQAATPARISPYMQRLESAGILCRIHPLFEQQTGRQVRYEIADQGLRFWLRFFAPLELRTLAEARRWDDLKRLARTSLPSFLRTTLEAWLRASLLEKGPWLEAGRWWNRQGSDEIPLVAMVPGAKRLLLAEAALERRGQDKARLAIKAEHFLEAHPEFRTWRMELGGFSVADILKA